MIIKLQQKLREVGRIRSGEKAQNDAPKALDRFRLTSQDKYLLEEASKIYGGKVRPWTAEKGQFELYIEADEINVVVAPVPIDQWYEAWTKGGCAHRCDGANDNITGRPCICDHDNPTTDTCKLTTRLWLMLPELPSLGTWRLESHGYYAAVELPADAEILSRAASKGTYIPAALAIEKRKRVTNNATKVFAVPVLRLRMALNQVISIRNQSAPALETGSKSLPEPMQVSASPTLVAWMNEWSWSSPESKEQLANFKTACKELGLQWLEAAQKCMNEQVTDIEEAITFLLRQSEPAELFEVQA